MTNTQYQTAQDDEVRNTSGPDLWATVASEVLKLRTLAFPKVLGLIAILLAAAAAFVLRSTGGAVVVALAVMFVQALVNVLPSAGQEILLPFLPSSAIASISALAEAGDPAHLVPMLAVVSLLVWWGRSMASALLVLHAVMPESA